MEADQAVLASLRKESGAPFGIPLGFVYSGDCFYITTGKDRGLPKRLRNDERVCSRSRARWPIRPSSSSRKVPPQRSTIPTTRCSRRILLDGPPDKFEKIRVDPERFFESWVGIGDVVFPELT